MEDAQLKDTDMDASWMEFQFDTSRSQTSTKSDKSSSSTSVGTGFSIGLLGISGNFFSHAHTITIIGLSYMHIQPLKFTV